MNPDLLGSNRVQPSPASVIPVAAFVDVNEPNAITAPLSRRFRFFDKELRDMKGIRMLRDFTSSEKNLKGCNSLRETVTAILVGAPCQCQ
jgi:hypothetical protein